MTFHNNSLSRYPSRGYSIALTTRTRSEWLSLNSTRNRIQLDQRRMESLGTTKMRPSMTNPTPGRDCEGVPILHNLSSSVCAPVGKVRRKAYTHPDSEKNRKLRLRPQTRTEKSSASPTFFVGVGLSWLISPACPSGWRRQTPKHVIMFL